MQVSYFVLYMSSPCLVGLAAEVNKTVKTVKLSMKAGPSQLIPKKLATNLELLIDWFYFYQVSLNLASNATSTCFCACAGCDLFIKEYVVTRLFVFVLEGMQYLHTQFKSVHCCAIQLNW